MSSKKKIIISLSALALVIVAAVVAVVAVLAAQNVTLTSNISISYTVDDIYGTADVYVKIGSGTFTKVGEDLDLDTLDTDTTETRNPSISLSKDNQYAIVRFGFKKDATNVENFTATLSVTQTTLNNMTVTCGQTYDSSNDAVSGDTYNNGISTSTLPISSTDMTYYYIKIALNNTNQDAECDIDVSWILTNIDA